MLFENRYCEKKPLPARSLPREWVRDRIKARPKGEADDIVVKYAYIFARSPSSPFHRAGRLTARRKYV